MTPWRYEASLSFGNSPIADHAAWGRPLVVEITDSSLSYRQLPAIGASSTMSKWESGDERPRMA